MAKGKQAVEVSESVAASVEIRPLDSLAAYARNARTHDDAQISQLMGSMIEWGFTNPVLADADGIVAGHGRCMAARRLYEQGKKIKLPNGKELPPGTVPVIDVSGWSEAKRRAYILADNQLATKAGWDFEMLAVELDELRDLDYDLTMIGFDQQELNDLIGTPEIPPADGDAEGGEESARLADRFMIPPFTVMNAREGWWQDRKRAWLALGIKSENGRDAATGGSKMVAGYKDGERVTGMVAESDTSIYDPVLCELSYRWFSPPGGTILDPFAGGSVRGIVASKTGRQYIGHELRAEQVAANRQQAADICADDALPPVWIEGDSRNIDKTCKDIAADFVYTCPPYADLEVYSDNPADLSTLKYEEFRAAYFEIIAKACARLKANRFAAIVVGEVRDKKGNYYDFVGDTVQAFRDAGMHYYNEAILVTAVGSLPIRAGKQFSASRKLGKTHQNVLVFVKGDAKKAVEACGDVEVSDECFAGQAEESEAVA